MLCWWFEWHQPPNFIFPLCCSGLFAAISLDDIEDGAIMHLFPTIYRKKALIAHPIIPARPNCYVKSI